MKKCMPATRLEHINKSLVAEHLLVDLNATKMLHHKACYNKTITKKAAEICKILIGVTEHMIYAVLENNF